jgi:RNA polymerase sigma-70 factor (sigma-E family)
MVGGMAGIRHCPDAVDCNNGDPSPRRSCMEATRDLEDLLMSSRSQLLRLALMLSGGVHTAEDLVQSALTRAFRHRDRVLAAERPEAYLRTMVLNEFLSWRRLFSSRETPTQLIAEARDTSAESDPADRHAQRDAAWRLLARLPRRQRAVLVLRYYEDLTDDEIATLLGCSPGTVRSNASRALAALRAAVPALDEETLP